MDKFIYAKARHYQILHKTEVRSITQCRLARLISLLKCH